MVSRHEFLSGIHQAYRPRSYLEIGVNDGRSLTLSRVPSIGIDPAFKVTAEITCDVRLVKATSDDFFSRKDPVAHLPGGRIDLAFIDGMHLFEYVLRDFINVERHAAWSSVIVIDDVLPRSVDEAARNRHTGFWTGDVYKLTSVLRQYRPDLTLVLLDTQPTGLLLVLGADPTNTTLADSCDQIIRDTVREDPQKVPQEILKRTTALDPRAVLQSTLWADLAKSRDAGHRRRGQRRMARSIASDLTVPSKRTRPRSTAALAPVRGK